LRLSGCKVGLLNNFNVVKLTNGLKKGLETIINSADLCGNLHPDSAFKKNREIIYIVEKD